MTRWFALPIAAVALVATTAYAQETGAGPGTIQVTAIPGGAIFFAGGDTESKFHNFNLGGAFTYNINHVFGVEGELGTTLGMTQNLLNISSQQKTPNTLAYTGNVVVSAPLRYRMAPYATAGIGRLTLFESSALGINSNASFVTANFGGGVNWYVNTRWGLRGDYRLLTVRSSETAPAFFGQENRLGQRVYGGLVFNVKR